MDGRLLRPATNPISNIMTAGGIAERIPRKWMVPIHGRFLGSDDQSIRWTWPNQYFRCMGLMHSQSSRRQLYFGRLI